jgi:hypothetical protein
MKALRLPTRVSAVTYFVRFRRPRDPPVFVSAVALLEELEVPSWPGRWVPVARGAGRFTWTPVGYLRSPGDPSCAFAPLPDPGRTDVPLPSVTSILPPLRETTKASDNADFGAHSRSFRTCSPTLRVSCCHSRARLASGWLAGLYREGVEPSGSLRKVSDHMIVPLSCPPDATHVSRQRLSPHGTPLPSIGSR